MKIVTDISDEAYDMLLSEQKLPHDLDLEYLIIHSTPLEKHDEEVIKMTVESIWGKPPYTELLDKIKDEIKEWYWDADKQKLSKDPCVVDAMIDLFVRTINKYKKESEESQMTDYQKQINNIMDTISGEICRMCVTDNKDELDTMYTHAIKNLEKLRELMYQKWEERLEEFIDQRWEKKERKVNNADSN